MFKDRNFLEATPKINAAAIAIISDTRNILFPQMFTHMAPVMLKNGRSRKGIENIICLIFLISKGFISFSRRIIVKVPNMLKTSNVISKGAKESGFDMLNNK